MVEIIFQSKNDAEKFYHHLRGILKLSPENEKILLTEDRHILKILEERLTCDCLSHVKNAFYEFVTDIKRDDWFKRILTENFYFKDLEEIQHVLDIIYSILEGERKELKGFLKKTSQKERIKEDIDQVFEDQISFSFDSFVKFRLRPYFLDLESYVKISIDEYKMEQEYQIFIQTLREFLQDRIPKMEILHLLLGEDIIFYNESFEEVKRGELVKMIDRKLLFNHPVYVDSASIAPLLSIAPAKIFLYPKNPEEALIRTIHNIFEERVTIMPLHEFFSQFPIHTRKTQALENE